VAQENSDVLKAPEPFVMFDDFATTSLNFTLYTYVGDVNKAGNVRTELAIAILDAFSKAGIVIPFGRTDIALQKMDWLRGMVAEFSSPAIERHSKDGNRTFPDGSLAAK
jgi:potassium-dependent mechanosensitive channel